MHKKLNSILSSNSQRRKINSNTGSFDGGQLTQLHVQLIQLVESKARDQDIIKITEAIKVLSRGLDRASQSELELGHKSRQYGRQQQLNLELEQKYQQMKSKNEDLEQQNRNLKLKIDELQFKNSASHHQFQLKQKMSEDLNHKVYNLEQRLEIILESDFANDNVSIRKTLTDLVKECERQKRDLQLKNHEISRLTEQLKSAHLRISKLNQKLELMKKKISIRELENLQFDKIEFVEQDDKQNDPTMVLHRYLPNDNLDFRINALKLEFAEIMYDISEQGTAIFSQKIMQLPLKNQREQVQLVTAQFLSFKDFAEKLNMAIKCMLQLSLIEDLQAQMSYIENQVKHVFMCQNTRLWILDAQMGILYTNNNQRALINKGTFSEVLKFQKPINKRDYALLFDGSNGQSLYINQCICFPLFNQNHQLCGVFEVSNSVSDYFSFDEEYYGVLLAKYCESLLHSQIKNRLMRVTLGFNSFLQDSFQAMLNVKSLFELFRQIRYWIETILTVSAIAFYFVKDDKFLTYQTTGITLDGMSHQHKNTQGTIVEKQLEFKQQGLAGLVCKRKKVSVYILFQQLIVMNMKKTLEFDETIDLDSMLPVLILPIIGDQQVYGVFEVPIKQRNLLKTEKDKIMLGSSSVVGLDQSFEVMAEKIGQNILNAIKILNYL